jgi:hypothetical protein
MDKEEEKIYKEYITLRTKQHNIRGMNKKPELL